MSVGLDILTPTQRGDDDYTNHPTHLRIFSEVFLNEQGVMCGVEWYIDGRDDNGRYTEACWTYDKFDEAVAALPEFVRNQETYNRIRFIWRNK